MYIISDGLGKHFEFIWDLEEFKEKRRKLSCRKILKSTLILRLETFPLEEQKFVPFSFFRNLPFLKIGNTVVGDNSDEKQVNYYYF